jgi:hypothetical protein
VRKVGVVGCAGHVDADGEPEAGDRCFRAGVGASDVDEKIGGKQTAGLGHAFQEVRRADNQGIAAQAFDLTVEVSFVSSVMGQDDGGVGIEVQFWCRF